MNSFSQENLLEKINQSIGLKLLVPCYQNQILTLANSNNFAEKRALFQILELEDHNDLQSISFQEDQLAQFVQTHFPVTDQKLLLIDFHNQAKQLLRSLFFFSTEQKQEILPSISNLSLEKTKELIEIFRQGHRKQSDYLSNFAEKDPRLAFKFQLLSKT